MERIRDSLIVRLEVSPQGLTRWGGASDDPKLYLADPVLPAHSLKAGCSQDDGCEVLLLVQLLQTRVQVPTLKMTAKGNTSKTSVLAFLLKLLLKPSNDYFHNATSSLTTECPLKGYNIFEFQMGESLLQLSSAAQRAGADHATQTRRMRSVVLLMQVQIKHC